MISPTAQQSQAQIVPQLRNGGGARAHHQTMDYTFQHQYVRNPHKGAGSAIKQRPPQKLAAANQTMYKSRIRHNSVMGGYEQDSRNTLVAGPGAKTQLGLHSPSNNS